MLFSIFIKTTDYQKIGFFEIIKKITRSIWFGSYYHLWFVYLILGLYLTVPIISAWTTNNKKKEMYYFLILFAITVLFRNKLLKNYSPNIDLTLFSGYIGYFILGYFMSNLNIKNQKKWAIISFLIFFAGIFFTCFCTYWFSVSDNKFNGSFYDFLGLNVVIISISIFMFFRASKFLNRYNSWIFKQINKFSFGIYLVHALILWFIDKLGFNALFIHPLLGIPLTTILCVCISLIIVKGINKIPFGNYISG